MPSNPSKDYYFIYRDTPNTEAIIVEYDFLNSPKDEKPIDLKTLKEKYGFASSKLFTWRKIQETYKWQTNCLRTYYIFF